jgi:hypothetical protein
MVAVCDNLYNVYIIIITITKATVMPHVMVLLESLSGHTCYQHHHRAHISCTIDMQRSTTRIILHYLTPSSSTHFMYDRHAKECSMMDPSSPSIPVKKFVLGSHGSIILTTRHQYNTVVRPKPHQRRCYLSFGMYRNITYWCGESIDPCPPMY